MVNLFYFSGIEFISLRFMMPFCAIGLWAKGIIANSGSYAID